MPGCVLAVQKLATQRNQTFGKFIIAGVPKLFGLVSCCQPSPALTGRQASLALAFCQESPSKSVPMGYWQIPWCCYSGHVQVEGPREALTKGRGSQPQQPVPIYSSEKVHVDVSLGEINPMSFDHGSCFNVMD